MLKRLAIGTATVVAVLCFAALPANAQYAEPDDEVRTTVPSEEVPDTAATGSLPRTGSDSLPWVRIGLILVALGGIILLSSRKRYSAVSETV